MKTMNEQHNQFPVIKCCLSNTPPGEEPIGSSACNTAEEEIYFYMLLDEISLMALHSCLISSKMPDFLHIFPAPDHTPKTCIMNYLLWSHKCAIKMHCTLYLESLKCSTLEFS